MVFSDKPPREKIRGQVGIGTLVVFIAMVLVASIASGVLINTAGVLQTRSEQTGEESVAMVTDRLTVTGKYGRVGDGGDQILLDSSDSASTEDDEKTKESFTVQSGEKLQVNTQGSSCGDPNYLVVNGTSSDNRLQNNDQLLVENAGDGRIRFTHLDDAGNLVGTIETAGSPVSLRAEGGEGCDYEEIYFREQQDYESDFLVDETGTADVSLTDEYVDRIDVTVKRSPGSDALDLSEMTVVYNGPENLRHLSYSEASADESNFTVESVQGSGPVLANVSDTATVRLNATALSDGAGLSPGADLTVYAVTRSGARIPVHLSVPDHLSKQTHQL
ncbi:archaellin/type IV pilin N-terminal domain-containing protein [Halorussus marinus]|uniref:archaellin/type IV pilin N-terminal domain-containing protein n=1 Tax=Halorussus marinus TaxID=2505976 RepID=UPI00106E6AB8|nr:archaellin/type IV pilin N-terminal domain-containing protein [Halorussus marinus]